MEVEEEPRIDTSIGRAIENVARAAELHQEVSRVDNPGREGRGDMIGGAGRNWRPSCQTGCRRAGRADRSNDVRWPADRSEPRSGRFRQREHVVVPVGGGKVVETTFERP